MAKKTYVGVNTVYTPIEYLLCGNTSGDDRPFIDTGVFPNSNIHCIVDFQCIAQSGTGGIIGGWQSNAGMLFGVNSGNFRFAFGTSAWAGNSQQADLNRHIVYLNDENGDGRLGNTVLASHTDVSSLANSHRSIYLFASNGGSRKLWCEDIFLPNI